MRFVSDNGSDAHQSFSLITTDFEATAQEGSVVQKRTDGGMRGRSRQGGWEFLRRADLWDQVERVSEQALELVTAPECPSETASLILMPDQMMLQIHESIGHPLELDRILGDERNYAGWSFVKKEDFGNLQYGSSVMNVTFDPTVPTEFASYAFDDNGSQAKREFLIQDGKLLRGLGGLESQARSGIPGVANARASSWNRAPIDRMANLNLEPGNSSLEEMIASVERGVLMESNRSWSIDDFRNKFQFGCEYGKLIENGKITRTVRNPNYRGVTVPFWRSLKKVGNAATRGIYGTPNCGKGEPNQIIRVGHASPICLFENVEIFGGAS
jgi:predicted Zn-dependent protease